MGVVKFKGEVVYEGPLAAFNISDGWNNSMAEYYPTASIHYVANEELRHQPLLVPNFTEPFNQRICFDIELDQSQVHDLNRIVQARKDAEEAKIVRLHKVVKVVRGRKVKIGTEGEVFWMGNSGFGPSVGLRLMDGSKVFTALKNVETVTLDKAFESEVLGLK